MNDIDIFKETRKLAAKFFDSASEEELLVIPEGYNNNLIWNFGHLVVTQQLLNYKLSGLALNVDDEYVTLYSKGSSPKDSGGSTADIKKIRSLLISLPEKLEEDHAAGLFKEFNNYTTSAGVTLSSVDDAIKFNNFHEGLHLGYIMAMKRKITN